PRRARLRSAGGRGGGDEGAGGRGDDRCAPAGGAHRDRGRRRGQLARRALRECDQPNCSKENKIPWEALRLNGTIRPRYVLVFLIWVPYSLRVRLGLEKYCYVNS